MNCHIRSGSVVMKSGLFIDKEHALPLVYLKVTLDYGNRVDLPVDGKPIIGVNAVEALDVQTSFVGAALAFESQGKTVANGDETERDALIGMQHAVERAKSLGVLLRIVRVSHSPGPENIVDRNQAATAKKL